MNKSLTWRFSVNSRRTSSSVSLPRPFKRLAAISGNSNAVNEDENRTSKPLRQKFRFQLPAPVTPLVMRDVVGAAPQPRMLRHRDDRPAPGLRSRAHSAQDPLVVRDVFDHIECAGEIEDANAGNVACIHLHELHFRRQAFSRVGQSGRVQFGADQTLPRARLGDGAQARRQCRSRLRENDARPERICSQDRR